MAERRKDNRGRILRTGESQRKDGRYQFQYTDAAGKRHCVYALNLVDLREREKVILRDLEDGIRSSDSKKITLNDLIEIYLENHRSIRKVTEISYRKAINAHIKDSFIGNKPIANIRNSDMIKFSSIRLLVKSPKTCYTLAKIGSRSCLTSSVHSA